jgi:hypothetical protein
LHLILPAPLLWSKYFVCRSRTTPELSLPFASASPVDQRLWVLGIDVEKDFEEVPGSHGS